MNSNSSSPVSPTQVIHVHEMDRFPDAVYVGRKFPRFGLDQSPLANPFKISKTASRQDVVTKYEAHLLAGLLNGTLVEPLIACRGHEVACWCRRSDEAINERTRCHGDVIHSTLARYSDDELRALSKQAA